MSNCRRWADMLNGELAVVNDNWIRLSKDCALAHRLGDGVDVWL